MIKKNEGFTIIEILVSINIAFIAVTFIISFYLFTNKFITESSGKLYKKQNTESVLFYIKQVLHKTNNFNLLVQGKDISIITDDGKNIVFSKNELALDEQFRITEIDDIIFNLELKDGSFINLLNSDDLNISNLVFESKHNYLSNEIKRFEIEVLKEQNIYKLSYYTPNTSAFQFQNLK